MTIKYVSINIYFLRDLIDVALSAFVIIRSCFECCFECWFTSISGCVES